VGLMWKAECCVRVLSPGFWTVVCRRAACSLFISIGDRVLVDLSGRRWSRL
jgi:hypothetical protein